MTSRHLAPLVLLLFAFQPEPVRAGLVGPGGHPHHQQPVPQPQPQPQPQPCYAPCYTVFKAGEESADLQVHLRGASHDVLEIFFNENVARYAIPGEVNLCTHGRVLMPRKNDRGTFAVQYGWAGFAAFGWKGDRLVTLTPGRNEYPATGSDPAPHVVQIDIDPRFPVRLEWVTTRILRVVHGPDCSLEYLLRFDGDSKPWKLLYAGPVGAR